MVLAAVALDDAAGQFEVEFRMVSKRAEEAGDIGILGELPERILKHRCAVSPLRRLHVFNADEERRPLVVFVVAIVHIDPALHIPAGREGVGSESTLGRGRV